MRWIPYNHRSVLPNNCASVRESLSRFLDTDLRGEEATRLAAHLNGCLPCRAELEALRAQRALRTALPAPPGGRAARERVLRRVENAVHRELPPRRHPGASVRAVSAGVVGLAGLAAILISQPRRAARLTTPAPHAALSAVALPERDDLDRYFALHDQCSRAARRPEQVLPAPRKSVGPPPASGAVARAAAGGSPDPTNPDDIPEAL